MSKVYIERCEHYELEAIEDVLFRGLDKMPQLQERLATAKKVLVKPNLLKGNKPEEGVTTHPLVIEAVIHYLKRYNCEVILGDSPGGPFTVSSLKSLYRQTGMAEVAERTGCQLNYAVEGVTVENPKAKRLLKMEVIRPVVEADFIINVAKLKTHCMMMYTGAVKNLFGLIPGLIKADYHLKMKSTDNFAEHLVDISEFASPEISIIDGIVAMEGDGPSAGTLRNSGVLILSDNPYSADLAGSRIMGMEEWRIPTIQKAKERKLPGSAYEEIEFLALKPEDVKKEPFQLPNTKSVTFMTGHAPAFLERFVLNSLRPKPVIMESRCVKCGVCAEVCPAKTILMDGGYPDIKLEECIRCFCCHELCPKKAIEIKRNWAYDRIMGVKR